MIAAILQTLGLADELPDDHAARAAHCADLRKQVDTAEAEALEVANSAIAKARRDAAAKREALAKRAEEHAVRLADGLAKDVVPALAPIFSAYSAEPSRRLLGDLAEQIRTFDARSQVELGAELRPMLVAVSFATALVSASPKAESAFCSPEAFTGDVLSSAARLARAAVSHANAVALEAFTTALEAGMAKRVRQHAGREVTAEQRETWKAMVSSGRNVDCANRLHALAERHGAARHEAFVASYTPATEPIIPHIPQPSHADLFA